MSPIFESILPIFLIVLLGIVLRRLPVISGNLWEGLEQLGYYVLFPALLFLTLYRADFTGLSIGAVAGVVLVAYVGFSGATLLLWPVMRRSGIQAPAFTSVFQTATRWNAFIALAIAEKLYGGAGLGLVALVMAFVVVPINLINVSVLIVFGPNTSTPADFARRLVTNPLVLGCLAGILMRFMPFELYGPVEEALNLVARTALGLGLLMVGAGLRLRDALVPRFAVILPSVLKLLGFPLLMAGVALAAGITGDTFVLLILCAGVPTAMNGFILARQLGGDAPLYAAITTVQTAASFATLPLVLAMAA